MYTTKIPYSNLACMQTRTWTRTRPVPVRRLLQNTLDITSLPISKISDPENVESLYYVSSSKLSRTNVPHAASTFFTQRAKNFCQDVKNYTARRVVCKTNGTVIRIRARLPPGDVIGRGGGGSEGSSENLCRRKKKFEFFTLDESFG